MTTSDKTSTPDPRTAPDDQATKGGANAEAGRAPDNHGVSSEDPAEGSDDQPAAGEGSARG